MTPSHRQPAAPSPEAGPAATGAAQRVKRKKPLWRRKRAWALALLLGVPTGVGTILTSTDALGYLVLPKLARGVGGEVDAASVRLTWSGRVVMEDLEVRAPGLDGAAGRVLAVPSVVADISWGGLLTGASPVRTVRLVRPTLRVSEDTDTRQLNLALFRAAGRGGSGQASLPEIAIVSGLIELSEHDRDSFTPLSTLRVRGTLTQLAATPGIYTYRLTELDRQGQLSADAMTIEGNLNIADGSALATLTALDLADWSSRTLPSAYQSVWEQLGLRGRIPEASLTYSNTTGVEFEVAVDNVDLNLPVRLDPDRDEALVAMTDVTGTLGFSPSGFDADLGGNVEDIPVRVSLRLSSFTQTTAARMLLMIDDYALGTEPALLPAAPPIARKVLDRFSSPTATINASIEVERPEGAGGTAAPWGYRGRVELTGGEARYEEFTYPLTDINAVFEFNNEAFLIAECTGTPISGGTASITGSITPPGDGAEVDIRVEARGVPIDDVFRDAMPPDRRDAVDVLFDDRAHDRLIEAGLFRAVGNERFRFGGEADLDIHIYRPLGPDSRYTTNIEARIPEAGVVPIGFPYPVIARDVVLNIGPGNVEIRPATLEGLSGMVGSIEGNVALLPGGKVDPDVRLTARGMPIDEALLQALPSEEGVGAGAFSPRQALEELELIGAIDGSAHVRKEPDGRIGFEVYADLVGVRTEAGAAVPLNDVNGRMRITLDTLGLSDLTGVVGGAPFDGALDVVFPRPLFGIESLVEARFAAKQLDLRVPLENLASRFNPSSATTLSSLRERFDPAGLVDSTIDIVLRGAADPDYTLRVTPRSDASFTIEGLRHTIEAPAGTATISPDRAQFDGFSAAIGIEGQGRSPLHLDGMLPLRASAGPGELTVSAESLRLDSQLVERTLRALSPGALQTLAGIGIEDALFSIDGAATGPADDRRFTWRATPQAIDVHRRDVRTGFDASGAIVGEGEGIRLEQLALSTDGWDLTLDGAFDAAGAGTVALGASATEMNDNLLSILPVEAARALEGLDVRILGLLVLDGARLTFDGAGGAGIAGDLAFEGLSMSVGTEIEIDAGTAKLAGDSTQLTIEAWGQRGRCSGISITDARLSLTRTGPLGSPLRVPTITARAHGGRIVAEAVVRSDRGTPYYEFNGQLAGVRFGDVLVDLGAADADADRDRGLVDANLTLAGPLGDGDGRRGRIIARVQGGRVLDMPGVIPLLELANLQAPANERVDLGYIDIFINGDDALVDRLALFSRTILVAGTGRIDIASLGIDLAVSTKGAGYVPILSPLIEGIRDELLSTRVSGTLREPEFRTEQFRNTRALLDAITGAEERERDAPAPRVP